MFAFRIFFCCLPVILMGCATMGRISPFESRDDVVRLQIYLDGRGFGPGVIDGRRGEFTEKALARYRISRSLPLDYQPETGGISPFTSYTIREEDVAQVGAMAAQPEEVSKQNRQPYTSLLELVAERFRTSEDFLRSLNPGLSPHAMGPGATLTVPNVSRPFAADQFPSAWRTPSRASLANRRVQIDVARRMLEVWDGEQLLAAFPATPGSAEHPAPVGEWRIIGATPWPWFRYDEGVLKRGERTSEYFLLPPGPNSPVGVLWAGLNRPGIGIHGSPKPAAIGRTGSHGCIRLTNWDAATFYTLVGNGVPVEIR